RLSVAGGQRAKAKLGRLEEQVVEVYAAAFNYTTEAQVVFRHHPTHIITPCEIVSHEGCVGVISKAKPIIHPDLLNRIRGGLEGNIRPQCLHTGHGAGRSPGRRLPRVAESEI